MAHLLIQLAQTVTGAVVTIVLLLMVAALIGYFTAWFYAKSVFVPKIKALEGEKASLEKQIDSIKDEVKKLIDTNDNLNDKIGKLNEKVAELEKSLA